MSFALRQPLRLQAHYHAPLQAIRYNLRWLRKMDIEGGVPRVDRYAVTEERRFSTSGNPSLVAKQMGELTMAYEDCDTIPLLWRYASRFVLFDHIFQEMIGPSTLGNISIIAAETGQTQWALHPGEAYTSKGVGVPVLGDDFNPRPLTNPASETEGRP